MGKLIINNKAYDCPDTPETLSWEQFDLLQRFERSDIRIRNGIARRILEKICGVESRIAGRTDQRERILFAECYAARIFRSLANSVRESEKPETARRSQETPKCEKKSGRTCGGTKRSEKIQTEKNRGRNQNEKTIGSVFRRRISGRTPHAGTKTETDRQPYGRQTEGSPSNKKTRNEKKDRNGTEKPEATQTNGTGTNNPIGRKTGINEKTEKTEEKAISRETKKIRTRKSEKRNAEDRRYGKPAEPPKGNRRSAEDRKLTTITSINGRKDRSKSADGFEWAGEYLLFPKEDEEFEGGNIPMGYVTAEELCEATDLFICDKWLYAPLIVAVLCRPEGEPYDESAVRSRAERLRKIPMKIVFRLYATLMETHRKMKEKYPLCYADALQKRTEKGENREAVFWNDLMMWAGNHIPGETDRIRKMNGYDFMALVHSRIKMQA